MMIKGMQGHARLVVTNFPPAPPPTPLPGKVKTPTMQEELDIPPVTPIHTRTEIPTDDQRYARLDVTNLPAAPYPAPQSGKVGSHDMDIPPQSMQKIAMGMLKKGSICQMCNR